MTKPVTMHKALRVLDGTAVSSTVDIFIQYVNTRFASKATMLLHRCSPALGHFYQVGMDLTATPEECLAIEEAFKPGWKGVKVVYWQGHLGISLDCVESRNWTSHYNGALLSACVIHDDTSLQKAA